MREFHKIWIEQCEAARDIREGFGVEKALGYLIGEKLLNYCVTLTGAHGPGDRRWRALDGPTGPRSPTPPRAGSRGAKHPERKGLSQWPAHSLYAG
jgi:hypothetical protein